MISQGQRYRPKVDIPVICVTSWRAPCTGGHKRLLPAGEEFVIAHDPLEKATAVYADPANYQQLQSILIPSADRVHPLYAGYYLCISLETIAKDCELLGE